MENVVNLSLLPKEGAGILKALSDGNMVVARSKNDFIYILDQNGEYLLFSHASGAPSGGRKRLPKDEKHSAIVRNIAALADSLYLAEFDKAWSIHGVMSSAEQGILSLFPGDDRDADQDIEFVLPLPRKARV